MNTILASCSNCGDITLASGDVKVHTDSVEGPGDYVFRCPDCGLRNIVEAHARTVDLLIAAGARHEVWQAANP